jgi:hypothetical protein
MPKYYEPIDLFVGARIVSVDFMGNSQCCALVIAGVVWPIVHGVSYREGSLCIGAPPCAHPNCVLMACLTGRHTSPRKKTQTV